MCIDLQPGFLENAMAVDAINPAGIYQPSTYFQAGVATGTRILCLSGQAAIDAKGSLVGPGDLTAQTQQAYRNVFLALQGLGASFSDIAKLTVYVVDWAPSKMEALLAGAANAATDLGFDYRRPLTLVGVTGLASPEWLVEVEALAVVS
jgi:enamine deaminase RidA (YjgF/YER057c/UK114 family)